MILINIFTFFLYYVNIIIFIFILLYDYILYIFNYLFNIIIAHSVVAFCYYIIY